MAEAASTIAPHVPFRLTTYSEPAPRPSGPPGHGPVSVKHPVEEAGAGFLELAAEVGVSTMLIFTGPPICGSKIEMAVFLARMVMPRSRSKLWESSARSAPGW